MIYFVQGETTRLIKIGYTQGAPAIRLAQLQSSSPDKLLMLAVAHGTEEDEHTIHAFFKGLRCHYEWFKPEAALIEFIGYIQRAPVAAMRRARYKTRRGEYKLFGARGGNETCPECGSPKEKRQRVCDICFQLKPAPPEPAKRIPFEPRIIYQANVILKRARAKGEIERLPCQVCGGEASQAHHDDYTRPLDVMWLCASHRAERFKKLGWR